MSVDWEAAGEYTDIRYERSGDGIAKVTPVQSSATLSQLVSRPVHLKAENLQRTGSFKARGAVNTIATLDDTERAATSGCAATPATCPRAPPSGAFT